MYIFIHLMYILNVFSLKTCLLCIFFFNLITLDEHEWKYADSGRFLGW